MGNYHLFMDYRKSEHLTNTVKSLLFISFILFISSTCSLNKNSSYTDIGDAYTTGMDCHQKGATIFRSAKNYRKLNGNTILRQSGLYDSTLHFKFVSTFHKGLRIGPDSLFRNDELISVKHYSRGIQHGEQIEFEDSLKIVSTFVNGVMHGTQTTYREDKLVKSTHFNHGIKDSLEFYYDSLGNFASSIDYRFVYDSNWYSNMYLHSRALVSYSTFEHLDPEWLKRATYKGTISFYSHDPKGIANPSVFDVVDESSLSHNFCDFSQEYSDYFYVINKDDCVVCDHIDFDGIWIAYVGMHGRFGAVGLGKVEWVLVE